MEFRRCPTSLNPALLALLGVMACSSPPQPKRVEMVPIGTVPVATRVPEDDGAGDDVTSPNSGTSTALRESPCAGAELEALDELLPRCEAATPRVADMPAGLRDKIDVRLTASTPNITPGGRVDLQLVIRNKSAEPVPLYFTGDLAPRFEIETTDAKGRRVDRPANKAPSLPKGTKGQARSDKTFRITLLANGIARVRIAWDAQKVRWAPERLASWDGRGPYPVAPAGPLASGRYVLRVTVPIVGLFTKETELPRTPIDVGS